MSMMHWYTLDKQHTRNRSRRKVIRVKPWTGVVAVAGEVPPVDTVVDFVVVPAVVVTEEKDKEGSSRRVYHT